MERVKKLLLILLFAFWAGAGQAAELRLLSGAELAPALIRSLRGAKQSALLATYVFRLRHRGRTGELARELVRARKRGVKVEVFLEATGKRGDSLEEANRQAAAWLKNRGVLVRFDGPKRRSHAKAASIDSQTCFVGSHNLTESALKYNHELSVQVNDASFCRGLEADLRRNWD